MTTALPRRDARAESESSVHAARTRKERRWSGLGAAIYAAPAGLTEVPAMDVHRVTLHMGTPVRASCRCDGRVHRRLQTHGDIDLVPAGLPGAWEDADPATVLVLTLAPSLLHAATGEAPPRRDEIELVPQFQLRDPRVEHIGWALEAELEAGDAGDPLYAESLGVALAAHLQRRYARAATPATTAASATPAARGLSPRQLRHALEYIESRLDQSVSLVDLAAVAGLSASHFKVLFKRSVGAPVHQYVLSRRVERAKALLLEGRVSISQVALDAGFAHQSHMARWMRRLLGVTPTDLVRARR